MRFIKRIALLVMCIYVSFSATAQKPDSAKAAYFNTKISLISVETDMARRKQLANDLMAEVASVESDPAMQNIVERARMEQTRFFLIDNNYPSFKKNFDKLPESYRNFLVQSGYPYLVKDPDGAKFAVSYLENMKRKKELTLDSLIKSSASISRKNNAKDDYQYLLLSLTSAYMGVGDIGKAGLYIPSLIHHFGRQHINVNGVISEYIEKAIGRDSAVHLLEGFVAINKFNQEMETRLKRLYVLAHGSEKDFDAYIAGIKSSYRTSMRAELASLLKNEKAPDFTLKNLEGKEVSLSGLRGKVVVIDFWATWCAPCKASFPAMQQLVDEYRSKKDKVEFLFISSGERGADIKALVQKYISSTPYTFNILLDSPGDLAARAFMINAFPTKLIIDQQGILRFKPSHTENYDDMKMEMKMMIDYLADK